MITDNGLLCCTAGNSWTQPPAKPRRIIAFAATSCIRTTTLATPRPDSARIAPHFIPVLMITRSRCALRFTATWRTCEWNPRPKQARSPARTCSPAVRSKIHSDSNQRSQPEMRAEIIIAERESDAGSSPLSATLCYPTTSKNAEQVGDAAERCNHPDIGNSVPTVPLPSAPYEQLIGNHPKREPLVMDLTTASHTVPNQPQPLSVGAFPKPQPTARTVANYALSGVFVQPDKALVRPLYVIEFDQPKFKLKH